MFGYVTPCKMELKIKDYEKFKSYYCGICLSIKKNFGNIPRLTLNYDMTFLAILLDALSESPSEKIVTSCISHPLKKKPMIVNNAAVEYSAKCNVLLAYYKLMDNVADDNSLKSRFYSFILNIYLNKPSENINSERLFIEKDLSNLSLIENDTKEKNLDKLSHSFANLTGVLLGSYNKNVNGDILYKLGYNLGKWIYLIDAFDDLKKDMENKKFNAINRCFNENDLCYEEFYPKIKDRMSFILYSSARQCLENLEELPIKKNNELLQNILQYGLVEKMDNIFKRSELKYE